MATILAYIIFILYSADPALHNSITKDTIQIKSSGISNAVRIDSAWVEPGQFLSDSINVSGEIHQTGRQNSVEIQSQKSGNHGRTGQKVDIRQKGIGNCIKLNTGKK